MSRRRPRSDCGGGAVSSSSDPPVPEDRHDDEMEVDVAEKDASRSISSHKAGLVPQVQFERVSRSKLVMGDETNTSYNCKKVVNRTYDVTHNYQCTTGYDSIRDQSKADLRRDEQLFVETAAYKDASSELDENGLLLVYGPPCSGKTTLARALLRRFENQDYTPLILHDYNEWRDYVGENRKHVVLLDNLFGQACLHETSFAKWVRTFTSMAQFAKKSQCVIIITMYTHVLREIQACHEPFPLSDFFLLNIGSLVPTLSEKSEMIQKHLQAKEETVSKSDIDEILAADTSGPIFPWCLSVYAENPDDSTEIFSASERAYAGFMKKALNDREHGQYIRAMLLMSIKTAKVEECVFSSQRLKKELDRLSISIGDTQRLKATADYFMQSYFGPRAESEAGPELQITAGLALENSSLPEILEHCTLDFLIQYVRTEETTCQLAVTVNSQYARFLNERIYRELENGNLPELIQHPLMQNKHYLANLKKSKSLPLDFPLIWKDNGSGESLLYWSAFCPAAVLTDWCVSQQRVQDGALAEMSICLLKVMFVCALCGDSIKSERMQVSLQALRAANVSLDEVSSVTLKLPGSGGRSADRSRVQHLQGRVSSGNLLYLEDKSLQIPDSFLTLETTDSSIHIGFPNKQWYLALRLLADNRVDEKDEDGNTLLHLAAATGVWDVIKTAVQKGASLTAKNKNDETPYGLAQNRRKVINPAESPYSACADCASDPDDNPKGSFMLEKALLCYSSSVNDKNESGQTLLHLACRERKPVFVGLLIELGADVNAKDEKGYTPLHLVCQLEKSRMKQNILAKLLNAKVEVNVTTADGLTPLFLACQSADKQTAERLLQKEADVNLTYEHNSTLLHLACDKGNEDITEVLLQHNADTSMKNEQGKTALYIACEQGELSTAKALLRPAHDAGTDISDPDFETQAGSQDINQRFGNGSTLLHLACAKSNEAMLTFLLDHGADADITNDIGFTPLCLACQRGDKNIAEILLLKSDVNKTTGELSPLFLACNTGRMDLAQMLIKHKVDVNVTCQNGGSTLLHLVCKRVDWKTAELLVRNGASVNTRDEDGVSPLYLACGNGDLGNAELFLNHDADLDMKYEDGLTLLHLACTRGDVKLVQLLLEHKADVKTADNKGSTALHVACDRGDVATVEMLVQKSAEINVKNNEGLTPVEVACRNGYTSIVQFLIQNKAEVSPKEEEENNALHLACERGDMDMIRLIIQTADDVNKQNKNGSTAMHVACENGQMEATALLIENKADVKIKDAKGNPPLHLACEKSQHDTAELLLRHSPDAAATVNWKNDAGLTAVQLAFQNKDLKTAELLLRYGASVFNVGVMNDMLHRACWKGDALATGALLRHNAPKHEKDDAGRTPLDVACARGDMPTAELLLIHNSDANQTDQNGLTVLYRACEGENREMAQLLLRHNADVNMAYEEGGNTLLHLACKRNDCKTAELLLRFGADIHKQNNENLTPIQLCTPGETLQLLHRWQTIN